MKGFTLIEITIVLFIQNKKACRSISTHLLNYSLFFTNLYCATNALAFPPWPNSLNSLSLSFSHST
ncbi:prepilin-type N-terminal cleavage/methylation domain-containing protein [Ligilactobacillus salivarius]|nr:prepilin-type N-terminal cleavage/methylation domain-containing protein [Ligilactobacillus salivarius]TXJ82246.1 prepilin-type N-terminal cleavage/methylation domain-containing protein [Ligilactobacillus salivarius]